MPELNSEAGNILRSDIIDTVYDAAASDYEGFEEEEMPTRRLYGPTLQSLGIKHDHAGNNIEHGTEEIINDDNDFGDIDDDEIESYLLSENEAHLKSNIWMRRNGPHLEEMEKKRKERQEEEERKNSDPNRKKRPPIKRKEPINAKTHQDAMLQVIKEKRLSTKINYEVLAEIEEGEKEPNEKPNPTAAKIPRLDTSKIENAKKHKQEQLQSSNTHPTTSNDNQDSAASTVEPEQQIPTEIEQPRQSRRSARMPRLAAAKVVKSKS
jgi:hypothetical protein